MRNDYWKAEPDSETTLRFRAYSRKATLVATVCSLSALLVMVLIAFGRDLRHKDGWDVMIWIMACAAVPAVVHVLIERVAGTAFMRRILRERD